MKNRVSRECCFISGDVFDYDFVWQRLDAVIVEVILQLKRLLNVVVGIVVTNDSALLSVFESVSTSDNLKPMFKNTLRNQRSGQTSFCLAGLMLVNYSLG